MTYSLADLCRSREWTRGSILEIGRLTSSFEERIDRVMGEGESPGMGWSIAIVTAIGEDAILARKVECAKCSSGIKSKTYGDIRCLCIGAEAMFANATVARLIGHFDLASHEHSWTVPTYGVCWRR